MSMAGLIDPEMNHHKKSFHRRNDSGELDVFEAARYFSGYNEAVVGYNYSYNYSYNNASTYTQNSNSKIMMREERHGHNRARISLDIPIRTLIPHHHHGVVVEKQIINKEKKQKQPSSPGGRLASFLNSLFSQSASRKKKSKSTTQSIKDHGDESPGGWRRRRRSSISHFRSSSSSSTADSNSKSTFSSLSSGFRTPPYVVQTPTKSCKEFRTTMSEHKQQHAVSLSTKYNNTIGQHTKPTTLQSEFLDEKKKRETILFDDSYNNNNKQSNTVLSEKQRNWISDLAEKEKVWLEKYSAAPAPAATAEGEEEEENKEKIRKFSDEVDDGADSDSSSDLFELQNYDLGYYSSGLPVYETTNMDSIKRGAPISN